MKPRVADALFARMHLVLFDYKLDTRTPPREIRLPPRLYRLWRRCCADLCREDGREVPCGNGPDLFCDVPVRCSERVAAITAA